MKNELRRPSWQRITIWVCRDQSPLLAVASVLFTRVLQRERALGQMASPSIFSRARNGHELPRSRLSISSSLPSFSSSAVQEKYLRHPHLISWWIPLALPIPGIRSRRLRIYIPNVRQMHYSSMARFGRKRGSAFFCFLLCFLCFVVFAFAKRFGSHTKQWPTFKDPPTLIFKREDLQRIWKWEVNSGHYPSRYPSECVSFVRSTPHLTICQSPSKFTLIAPSITLHYLPEPVIHLLTTLPNIPLPRKGQGLDEPMSVSKPVLPTLHTPLVRYQEAWLTWTS